MDEAVRRVLRIKLALGLFEHPFVDEAGAGKALYLPATLALAQTAAERSLVLLKNDNVNGKPLLPLAKDTREHCADRTVWRKTITHGPERERPSSFFGGGDREAHWRGTYLSLSWHGHS